MATDHIKVMISSTALDLPEHRKEVLDACLRQAMFPIMMEHLPADAAEAAHVSLSLVDKADIYIGIVAHRYGHIPAGMSISVTELEYNRAVERCIPRLIFLMHDDHPLKASDLERGTGADKLDKFKERLRREQVVNFFVSPTDLRAHVIDSLSHYRLRELTSFHYVSNIPAPPEPYIAHPYTLLHTHSLVGRQPELDFLADWVSKPDADVYQARVLNIVAIGGAGKSALAWKWFNDVAPLKMKPMAGSIWWSFYESDAYFEKFVIRALAYVTGRSREDVQHIPLPERDEQLLYLLDKKPFLIVLDGLERILVAYARMDVAHLFDDEIDESTANYVAKALNLPKSAPDSFIGQHKLRKTIDLRAGTFLRKLTRIKASRLLVTTRLYPTDLQADTGFALPGSFAYFLSGLNDEDAISLWRAFGVSGSRKQLLEMFHTFENHPLIIRALAGEIAQYKRAPGDYSQWRRNHRKFDPFKFLMQVKPHVLTFALRGLDEEARETLNTIAGFRMPTTYNTLADILVGYEKIFDTESALDATLTILEDRGLLGWDRRANRYDLHPIVRGVTWGELDKGTKENVCGKLRAHFESLPVVSQDNVKCLEDLTSDIELYDKLIGEGRFDDAEWIFYQRLEKPTLHQLSAGRQRVEMLEMLFPDGPDQPPRLERIDSIAFTINALGQGYLLTGHPERAALLFRHHIEIREDEKNWERVSLGLCNLSYALLVSGALYEAEASARSALSLARIEDDKFREATSLRWLGLTLSARGEIKDAEMALRRSLHIFKKYAKTDSDAQSEGVSNAALAQHFLWMNDVSAASLFADRGWELSHRKSYEADFIHSARLQGLAALMKGDIARAEERLQYALTRARSVNRVEEELACLIHLAELWQQQGELDQAREILSDVWDAAEQGPYPILNAEAQNVLAHLEQEAGNNKSAITAANAAYRLSWCDGPPFSYQRGLQAAAAHLTHLKAPVPSDGKPFESSKLQRMVQVEIKPPHSSSDDPDWFG